MSDEKKFATVVLERGQDGAEWPYAIDVNGERLLTVGEVSDEDIDDIAKEINAAVEQREAKLREPAADLQAACVDVVTFLAPFYEGGSAHDAAKRNLLNAMDRMSRALAGTGPDYVPRAELEAERAKTRALSAAIEALDPDRYSTGALVCEWLTANGLKKPQTLTLVGRDGSISFDQQGWQEGDTLTIGGAVFRVERR